MWLVRFPFSIAIGLTAVTTGMWDALERGAVAAASSKSTIAASPASRPPACEVLAPPEDPSGPPPELTPTTIDAIGQAFYCILDNYVRGLVLDNRSLLVPAFAALTQELQRRGLDQPGATLPALTGKNDQAHRDRNWAAFSQIYEQIIARLPQDPGVRQAVAEATMRGMVESLHDNHVGWEHGFNFNDFIGMGLGGLRGPFPDPAATGPFFVAWVIPNGPADTAGVKPGDEIVAVNGIPPHINGVPSEGVLAWLDPAKTREGDPPVTITLHRPATDATFMVTFSPPPPRPPGNEPPPLPPPPPPPPPARLVDGDIAYVLMPAFFPGEADRVLAAVANLRKDTRLRGFILDLRGNRGGDPAEVSRLLGAFVHDKVTSYFCDGKDHCTARRPDDSVPLLNLPLVVLADRNCASACDSFTSTIKDLHLGFLVGTRTAGVVSGPAEPYLLLDGSILGLPQYYDLAANGEIVNTIGVAPDHYAPLTAADLSAGRDPGLAKAVEVLR